MPTADDLNAIPLLARLSAESRDALAESFTEETYRAGQRIVREGESGYEFFVVADGRAAVTKGDKQLGYLGAGDYFGEIAILGGDGRRSATVTATTAVTVWALFGISFRSLQSKEPTVADELTQAMSERLKNE